MLIMPIREDTWQQSKKRSRTHFSNYLTKVRSLSKDQMEDLTVEFKLTEDDDYDSDDESSEDEDEDEDDDK